MKDFGDFVRTATRPVLTFTALFAWIMFISEGIDYPVEFKLLVGAMVGTWFTERALMRIQGK